MSQHPNPYLRQPSVTYVQTYRTPYRLCPSCGSDPIRLLHVPFLTCASRHEYYECPTCQDTRVVDQRENIRYCGLLHPYHLCDVHHVPVVGTARVGQRCTCQRTSTTPQPLLSSSSSSSSPPWESPFV